MATNSDAILWLDSLCDGALDLTADNVESPRAIAAPS
jgi:hypothetical protein